MVCECVRASGGENEACADSHYVKGPPAPKSVCPRTQPRPNAPRAHLALLLTTAELEAFWVMVWS